MQVLLRPKERRFKDLESFFHPYGGPFFIAKIVRILCCCTNDIKKIIFYLVGEFGWVEIGGF